MTATFQSLQETRQPKALKAISLLSNLTRYDHAEHEAKALVNSLLDAVDEVDAAFAKKWGWPDDAIDATVLTGSHPPMKLEQFGTFNREEQAIPQGTADGGASFEAEVRWAIDAIKRGDDKLALNRLQRILRAT